MCYPKPVRGHNLLPIWVNCDIPTQIYYLFSPYQQRQCKLTTVHPTLASAHTHAHTHTLMPPRAILMGMCHFHQPVLWEDKLRAYSDRTTVNFSESLWHLHLKATNVDLHHRSFLRGVRGHMLAHTKLPFSLFLPWSVCFFLVLSGQSTCQPDKTLTKRGKKGEKCKEKITVQEFWLLKGTAHCSDWRFSPF